MMMPANFSAVNAEVVYGGAVADYLPSAWTAESVKRFNSNIITLVSNSFTSDLLKATLGVMFSGNWGEDLYVPPLDCQRVLSAFCLQGSLRRP